MPCSVYTSPRPPLEMQTKHRFLLPFIHQPFSAEIRSQEQDVFVLHTSLCIKIMGTITAIYPTHKFHAAASRLLTKHTVCSSSLQVYFKAQHQFNTMALRFLKEKKKKKKRKTPHLKYSSFTQHHSGQHHEMLSMSRSYRGYYSARPILSSTNCISI